MAKSRRRPADKFEERRRELAESALVTLGELGYARTTLREIASNSEFSHGVLHYYFSDKLDLIVFCVQLYKARCVHRYDAVVESSTTPDELLDGFLGKLAETIVEEAPMHRLWYDLRSQSMFEEALREPVRVIDQTLEDMVWRVVCRYAELLDVRPMMTPALAYGLLDGLFQLALHGYTAGREDALTTLQDEVRAVVALLFRDALETSAV
ncbi:transcriptional regulator, TetR family [Nocardioides terrae]|uniref:Transcriptional regulator, TetR family n=1 Tax=Nocardioides terrae TaxID=574651 RepID=A0A1I1IWJ6_9ACTN|nr:TetR/AcrR family transcriptional regulator [Nocardioides terrae]SFC40626.1 transcriptional regulator, TetR family [Nocardioides terrae]